MAYGWHKTNDDVQHQAFCQAELIRHHQTRWSIWKARVWPCVWAFCAWNNAGKSQFFVQIEWNCSTYFGWMHFKCELCFYIKSGLFFYCFTEFIHDLHRKLQASFKIWLNRLLDSYLHYFLNHCVEHFFSSMI